MLVIGVDGNEANVNERVGVHQYSYELLWALYKLQKELINKYRLIIYLKNEPLKLLPKEREGWNYKVLRGGGMWVLTKLTPELIKERKINVFFSPTHYLPPVPFRPKVCTIHDLGYLKFSDQFKKYDYWQLKYWTAISIFISKYIISVSNFNKKDIVRHYPFASGKVFVTHHGYDKQRFDRAMNKDDVRRIKKKYRISKNYILFLGTLKPSKNIEGLIKAYSLLSSDFPDVELVIAGKKGWLYEEIFKLVKDFDLESKVIFTDYIDEEDKPELIKGSRVFVSPSYWEGFGIIVLEAMACGIPVVISRAAGLPEVGGNLAIYVDQSSPKSIAYGIKKILNMPKRGYDQLSFKVSERAKLFSWKDTAKKTLNILEKAAQYNK